MPNQGGIRSDFTGEKHALVYGETRNLRWMMYDAANAPISSFAGWSTMFYWLPLSNTALASATFSKAGVVSGPPRIVVPLLSTDWATLPTIAGFYWYEMWRLDVSARLAYGRIQTIN